MDAVTYPDGETERFLAEHVVGYKPRIDEDKDLARHFGVAWTPGLLWLTHEGELCHSNVGFFEPSEFCAESLLGCGHVAARGSDWETARKHFEGVAEDWPTSHAAPAALYWAGVAAKKASGDTDEMMRFWKKLRADHPDDSWSMKVSFIDD